MSDNDWKLFLEDADHNKDGSISLEEFFLLLEKTIIR